MATEAATQSAKTTKQKESKNDQSVLGWKHALPIILSICALIMSITQSFIANHAVKVANEAATITAYDRGVNPVFELDRAYLANSDLRPFFYENKHLDNTDSNRLRVLALAELTLDCFEIVLTQLTEHSARLPSNQLERDQAWITEMFKNSEVLRYYLHSHPSWYSKALQNLTH